MKSTDVLRNEHIYIKKVLVGIRKQCISIVNGNKVDSAILGKLDKDFQDIEAIKDNENIRNKYIDFANSL